MNNVNLVGRITKNIELRYTSSQMAVAKFSVAVDRGKDKDGNDKGADFPNVIVFGRQAENCEKFLSKGSQVAIQGRLQTGSYEKDGNKVYTTDVLAEKVEFLGSKSNNTQNSAKSENKGSQGVDESDSGFAALNDSDWVPF